MGIHTVFDLLAAVAAIVVFRYLPAPSEGLAQPWRLHPLYLSLASLGMMIGALAAGTGNLLLSGIDEIGKSGDARSIRRHIFNRPAVRGSLPSDRERRRRSVLPRIPCPSASNRRLPFGC